MARLRRKISLLALLCCTWTINFLGPPVKRRENGGQSHLGAAGGVLAALQPVNQVHAVDVEGFSFLGKTSAEIFPVSNVSLLTWGLLIFLPSWEYLKPAALIAPVINAVLYVAAISFLLTHPTQEISADLLTLDGIVTTFRNPDGVLAGWLHYCVFDPLVGLGEVLDSQQNKVPHFLVVPCLILTLLFGPMGFLSYLAVRSVCLATRQA